MKAYTTSISIKTQLSSLFKINSFFFYYEWTVRKEKPIPKKLFSYEGLNHFNVFGEVKNPN